MNTLRVLVVNKDQEEAERLAGVLADANHTALPASGLEEASEALFVQKWDAVLLGSPLPWEGVAEFTAKLRQLESTQRAPGRTPVLSLSAQIPNGAEWCASEAEVDGYIAESFHPAVLFEAVRSLAAAANGSQPGPTRLSGLPVLDTERFREQLGFDEGLLVEIVDLFLAEGPQQVIEMHEALAIHEFERVSRVAHTIKGSLGTLHAAIARSHAQELELASKECDLGRCRHLLSALEYDLEVLEPQLLSLKNAAGGD